ncbi:iron-siderophore ABC transporter substrate-binding protein [Phormidium sp. FACHB-592]|uniref:Iron-siderophore ABC transporter substrate-binding protein n=1 Tax=Stenomitos frigidus AS-A4 TaxID=2933935 RepID=A0ABV0KHC3_9CYAN|nr:iron-siderophore ABC transporter substrate-binding protein [Phormidium sp. FACHB-592]MBD2073534.1 iron-siderophore ABC transporter substrate-binding protein [Phormidium sp. FACHB-592]
MAEPTAQAIKRGELQAKGSTRLLLLTTLAVFSISGCIAPGKHKRVIHSPADSNTVCQGIQHRSGTTKVCGQLLDVVALDPHALDLLLALGIQPIGYAEDRRALVGSPTSGKPTIQIKYLGDRLTRPPIHVGTWQFPSLETILKLKPDLILGRIQPSLYANLTQIAPTLPLATSDQERWQNSLLKLGKAMNREALAQATIAQHQQRMAITRTDLKPLTQRAKILLLSVSAMNQIQIFTDDTYAGGLLKELGFQLVVPEPLPMQQSEINISLETLPQLQTDTIIVMASGNSSVESVSKAWWNNAILRSLPASQTQRVYFVDYQLWSRIEGPISAELILKQIRSLLLAPTIETKV